MAPVLNTAFKSIEDFYKNEDNNCLYCNVATVATRGHLNKVHLKYAVCFSDNAVDTFSIPCHCEVKLAQRSHWHCPKCQSIIQRKHSFEKHLITHGLILQSKTLLTDLISKKETPVESDLQKSKSFRCPACDACFSSAPTLRRHELDKHHKETEPIFLVDEERGIFVTAQDKSGPRIIIHVSKSFTRQVLDCEVPSCREFMAMAMGRECIHLDRVKHFNYHQPPPLLQTTIIEMFEKGLISSTTKQECTNLNEKATQDGTPCVYPVFFDEHGYSGSKVNFSVYTSKVDGWCRFGRTRVTLDTGSEKWTCRCKVTKRRMCVHIYVSLCWTFQERRHLLRDRDRDRDVDFSSDTDNDLYSEDMEPGNFENEIGSERITKIVEYLCKCKKMPPKLPEELQNNTANIPQKFSPEETKCPYCPGPTPPDLSEEKCVTKNATVYGILTVQKGVHVFIKTCPVCRTPVRFQNYLTGFHNYNNKVFLTLQLCSFMKNLLRTHTAIGRFISAMEHQLNVTIHHNTIRRAFFHYSALTAYEYDFFCYKCGHHPPVVIADANWKLSFDVPVSTLKRPATKDVKDEDLSVNITSKWDRLEKEIIASGICEELKTHNPYSSELTHSSFVPWMGPATRVGDVLPKTEILKGFHCKPTTDSKKSPSLNEDELLRLIESKKASKSELIKACSDLGVPTEGSETDLINRLEEMLLYKDVYPKMFAKLQKTGGGVLHMGCSHSVVYYSSPLLWQESARDHTDGLLSFAKPPTIYISDIAGRVARHTNNRTKQRFFNPNDGRLCSPTRENIQAAQDKSLEVNLRWIKNLLYRRNNTNPQNDPAENLQRPHPITGSAERYSLYDRFHQKNQTRPEELLRSLNLVPDLCSFVNSSEAEQKNRELSFDRYFLCQMKETHFLFCTRLVFHLHNDGINQTFIKKMEKQTKDSLHIGPDGRLRLTSTEVSAPGGKVEMTEHIKQVVAKNGFSIGQFPIQEEHKAKLLELYKAPTTDYAVVQVDRALLYLTDLLSICPRTLLEEDLHASYPWLTDDAVNARVLQLARPLENVFTLQTFQFTAWWRNWINGESISSRHLHCIQGLKQDSKVLFPRVVGHQTPETGNHFILWVFDGSKTEIRVYDSLEKYTLISPPDMDILSLAFHNIWRLKEWSISYPDQWRQKDGVNCGVFVCTAAELDIKGTGMCNEPLNQVQLGHLRMHHAACLIANAVPKGKKMHDTCMAEAIHACNYYDSTGKGQSRPLYPHVQKEDWVKCEACNGWLHKDCASYEPSLSGIFTCGCDLHEPYAFTSTLTCLNNKGVEGLISKDRIKELKKMLDSGERKSNRMFLWQNPGGNRALKGILNGRPTCFNEKHMNDLIDLVKQTLSLDYSFLPNTDFIIDVMVPEATIDILMRFEDFSRYYAERVLGRIIE